MPVQSNLVLNTKTYAPRGRTSGDIAQWALAGDATFGGSTSFVTERVTGPNADGINRVVFKLDIPKAAAADTPCACIGEVIATGRANIDIVVPTAFTAAERDDFTKRVQSLVASAIYTAAQTNLESSW